MKQRVLEPARRTAEGFRHRQCADVTLNEIEAFPVTSFIAESEVGEEPA